MKLSDFQALTFDCYGTLIDWETGLLKALQGLIACAPRRRTREEVLGDYAANEQDQQRFSPTMKYSQLLAVVYKRLGENWGAPAPWEECATFAGSLKTWEPFLDTVAALKYLKSHYKLYILSNVDNESFSYTARKLGVRFDGIMTAEDIGSYKPSPRNFEYMLGRLRSQGIERNRVLHVAQSLAHDHVPANELGLASCWINRRDGRIGAVGEAASRARYDLAFGGMEELAEAHRKELNGAV
ncbi:MAG: haloacid dehalogenase type II [Gammaproteobacteria bacterium]